MTTSPMQEVFQDLIMHKGSSLPHGPASSLTTGKSVPTSSALPTALSKRIAHVVDTNEVKRGIPTRNEIPKENEETKNTRRSIISTAVKG